MSKFSMYCKHLLAANNLSIYQLSKQSDLERTALHRMVTGKQMPSHEFFEKFCYSLRVSIQDRQELTELYLEEKIGLEKLCSKKPRTEPMLCPGLFKIVCILTPPPLPPSFSPLPSIPAHRPPHPPLPGKPPGIVPRPVQTVFPRP